jgi:hypothetical protein
MDLRGLVGTQGPRLKKEIEGQLKRIKSALGRETEQTKKMLEIYQRYVQGEATMKEMDEANKQFLSFLKTIGLGVLAVLPFSPITIPAMVNLGKKVGIDILPDSFKGSGTL